MSSRAREGSGQINLLEVPLDDFELILDIDFLTMVKAMIVTHLGV